MEGVHAGYVGEGVVAYLSGINSSRSPVVTGGRSFVTWLLTWLAWLANIQSLDMPCATLEIEPADALTGCNQQRIKPIGAIKP